MEKLKQEDRNKLSRILYNNWDNVFRYLAGSSKDEDNVSYKEVYKYELEEATKDILSLIDIYLETNVFFSRDTVKNWLIENIIGNLLRDVNLDMMFNSIGVLINRENNNRYIHTNNYLILFPFQKLNMYRFVGGKQHTLG